MSITFPEPGTPVLFKDASRKDHHGHVIYRGSEWCIIECSSKKGRDPIFWQFENAHRVYQIGHEKSPQGAPPYRIPTPRNCTWSDTWAFVKIWLTVPFQEDPSASLALGIKPLGGKEISLLPSKSKLPPIPEETF